MCFKIYIFSQCTVAAVVANPTQQPDNLTTRQPFPHISPIPYFPYTLISSPCTFALLRIRIINYIIVDQIADTHSICFVYITKSDL